MIQFDPHPDCRACPLWEQARNPGLPARPADFQTTYPVHPRCLLAIGQNPGYNEDVAGKTWIGWAGAFLHGALRDFMEIEGYADAYLANCVRCYTPGNREPSVTQCHKCYPHLLADIQALIQEYGAPNVYLLALGAPATRTLTGKSIKRAVVHQGAPIVLPNSDLPPLATFYTYHPAALHPARNPALTGPTEDHLRLLADAMQGRLTLPTLPSAPAVALPRLPPARDNVIGLDIETYGILEGCEQTTFNPRRMFQVDGISRSRIVVRACLGWYDETGTIHTSTYRWADPTHRAAFRSALRHLPPGSTLVGMNTPFDVTVLRFVDPALCRILDMQHINLDDIALLNHLDCDMRPERSLKSISRVLRVMDYEQLHVSPRKGLNAQGDRDPNLILYNAADVVATLRARQSHLRNLRDKHGDDHPALHPLGTQFRSDLLWTVIHMDEFGAEYSPAALRTLHTQKLQEAEAVRVEAYERGLIVGGKGSMKSIRATIQTAAQAADLLDDSRLAITKKTKAVSTGKDNIHLLLSCLPMDSPHRQPVQAIEDFRRAQKITSTYTGVLLEDRRRGLINSRAYPTWFPVPTYSKDASGAEGGTRQGRFSAKDPPLQTQPPCIVACAISRYGSAGLLAAYDMSQMELRTAALIFGDPAMIEAFAQGWDIHHQTAVAIWPDLKMTDPDYREKRQVGKRINFLALYLGGWRKLIESVRRDIGKELSAAEAQFILDQFDAKYTVLRAGQLALIEQVGRDGFLLLPTGWKRTFTPDPQVAFDTYRNEIVNMPVQTLAAQSVQSSQAMILRERDLRRLTFCMSMQIHDSVYIDTHRSCFKAVDHMVQHYMVESPLWHHLETVYGRTVPLVVERKIVWPKET